MKFRNVWKSTTALLVLLVSFGLVRAAYASEIQLVAFIQDRPVGDTIGDWVIGGVPVEATIDTSIDGDEVELQPAYCVELKYEAGTGGNVATSIKTKSRSYCEAILTERGLVNSFPEGLEGEWTIAGVSYSADANTVFDGDLGAGVCVEIKFGETTTIATQIKERSDSDCEVTRRGLIDSRPPGDVIGPWIIDGVTVSADATTTFDGEDSEFAVNYCVDATYLNDGDGNPAIELKSRSRSDCEDVLETTGVIRTVPGGFIGNWDINGVTYVADDNTQLKQDKGEFASGVCAEVTYGAATSVATHIETRDSTDCETKFQALIEIRPADEITGTWTIGGVEMAVNADTVFDGDEGDFATGYCVEATYFADGLTNPAIKLKDRSRGDCEDVLTERARIASFPVGLEGTWVIGAETYIADSNTDFRTDRGEYATGVCVEVRYGATSTIATKIETRDTTDCVGPEQKVVDLVVSRPAGTEGPWTVGSVVAEASAETSLDTSDPSLLGVGYCVEMTYADDAGSDVALKIKAKDRQDCEAIIKTSGRIDALPSGLPSTWGIGGMTYIVDENTEQKDDKGPFELGTCVEVTYGAETTIATKVESRDTTDCMGPEIKLVDFVVDRPNGTQLGTWQIGDVSAEVEENTDIAGDDEDLGIGACVELKYREDGMVNIAFRIEDKNRSDCEEIDETRGRIDSFPTDLIGLWVVDGEAYQTNADTEFKQDKGDFASNACVQVRYGVESGVAVKIETRDDDDCLGPEMTTTDLIAVRPTGMLTGTWTIGDTTVEVDDETLIDGDETQLELGYCAEVKYVDDDGTNRALRLKDKDRHNCEEIVSAEGIIDTLPTEISGSWVISNTTVIVDANTKLEEKNGPFAVGTCVEFDYGATSTIATKIKSVNGCGIEPPEPEMYERVYGTIESFPTDLLGDWMINGDVYTVDADTQLKSKKGPLAVGACAKVDYLPSSGLALKIESADSDHCSADGEGGHADKDVKLYGILDSFPTDLIGTWVIDGVSYEAGVGTDFKEDKGPFESGACIEIKYLVSTNVILKAETDSPYHCGAPSDNEGSYAEVIGTVDALPDEWIGTWTVDGLDYSADDTTDFKEKYSGFEVGACVKIKYQTANDLALKIESKNPYECQEAITPTGEGDSELALNADTGAPGSTFVANGANFPPDTSVTVQINGEYGGTAMTDSSGSLTFALTAPAENAASSDARSARARASTTPYIISVAVDGETSDPVIIQVDDTQTVKQTPDNYTGPSMSLIQTPTAAQLVAADTTTSNSSVLLSTLALTLATLTFGFVLRRRRYAVAKSR